MTELTVAVVGATGAVGEAMLEILGDRDFPVGELHLLASTRSEGKSLHFAGSPHRVQDLGRFDFTGVDIALFSAGGEVSGEHVHRAVDAGAVVIDNTSRFRQDDDVPLVVPEVNGHRIDEYGRRGIIANPNCSTIQMVAALWPIQREVGIERINVATYQAVSGAGRMALEELAEQTANLLNIKPVEPRAFPVQMAFNAVPQVGDILENGYSQEEMKMIWETRKIFEDSTIAVNPTCVRIPVFFGHCEVVNIETARRLPIADVRALLRAADGVELVDEDRDPVPYPTPVTDSAGHDGVFVGRVREDLSNPNGINMWIVADNVRKGAALNSIQIAEILLKHL